MTLDEVDGVTTMTHARPARARRSIATCSSTSGMEGGMQVSYDRLEDLVRQPA